MSDATGFPIDSLHLRLRPSWIHLLLTLAAHLLALAGLWSNNLFHLALQLSLTLAVLASLAHTLRRQVLLKAADSIVELLCVRRRWRLSLAAGETIDGELMAPIYAGPRFTVLLFRTSRSWMSRPVVIAAHTLDRDEYRRLRVVLLQAGNRFLARSSK